MFLPPSEWLTFGTFGWEYNDTPFLSIYQNLFVPKNADFNLIRSK